ncbi:hypothetical protein D9613_004328 [Agrocybe pediades]|uniref:C2H2-type domain-containing protein n=1 Tax=Agrocybe pediades TaxID=84607 RepID=A0A8H4QJR4_9AGAR|nr:hypothetical protein D9613_004328 [Agrocybe pediades]
MPYHYDDSDSDDYAHCCKQCGMKYRSQEGLRQHCIESPDHYYCEDCNKLCRSKYGLHDHYRQSPKHHWCVPCKHNFDSAQNLKMHTECQHGPRDVECVSDQCDRKFVNRSAMIKHLENGICSSGINRSDVHKCVRRTDDEELIMKEPISVAYDSWNGRAFECPLCDKEFDDVKPLASHLISRKHQDKIRLYTCPDCDSRFGLFSAFVEHVDSNKCNALSSYSLGNAIETVLEQLAGDFSEY